MTTVASTPRENTAVVNPAIRRSPALDAVKGLLVLFMILYHWLNYFVSREGEIYRYIRFVTPSFLFITGLLLAVVYMGKYRVGDRRVQGRLFVRGLKLLALFTALNVAANLVLRANYNGAELGLAHFIEIAPAVYIAGDGSGAAFEVLIPISYLLAASPVLLWVARAHRYALTVTWLLLVGVVYLLKHLDSGSANLELFTMGVLGMVVGSLGIERLDRAARPHLGWLVAYAVYLGILNVLNVTYEVQTVGLVLDLAVLYMIARRLGDTGWVAGTVIELGQYSLFAYIAHIVILQALRVGMRSMLPGAGAAFLGLVAATALTVVTVKVTHALRARSVRLDRLYRFVFA